MNVRSCDVVPFSARYAPTPSYVEPRAQFVTELHYDMVNILLKFRRARPNGSPATVRRASQSRASAPELQTVAADERLGQPNSALDNQPESI